MDKIEVVLVHGYVKPALSEALQKVIPGGGYTQECYQEGGYVLTLASNIQLDKVTADSILNKIYEGEEYIAEHSKAGLGAEEIVLLSDPIEFIDEPTFAYWGGLHGYTEDGTEKYEG